MEEIYNGHVGSETPVFEPVELPSHYGKAFAEIGAAGLIAYLAATAAGSLGSLGAVHVFVAVIAAIGVYLVPRFDGPLAKFSKGAVAVLGTGAQALVPLIPALGVGAVTTQSWIIVAVAGLGALGVGITPNAPSIAAQYEHADTLA